MDMLLQGQIESSYLSAACTSRDGSSSLFCENHLLFQSPEIIVPAAYSSRWCHLATWSWTFWSQHLTLYWEPLEPRKLLQPFCLEPLMWNMSKLPAIWDSLQPQVVQYNDHGISALRKTTGQHPKSFEVLTYKLATKPFIETPGTCFTLFANSRILERHHPRDTRCPSVPCLQSLIASASASFKAILQGRRLILLAHLWSTYFATGC